MASEDEKLVEIDALPSSDEEEEDDEGIEIDLSSPLMELLEYVEDSLDSSLEPASTGATERVQVSPEFAKEAVDVLVTQGHFAFLGRYVLERDDIDYPRLLAALGFPLPVSVCADEKFGESDFKMALQVAIKYVLTHRPRLPAPRTLDEVCASISAAKKIMVITGAGISTSLGIPDFRSDDGLYAQLKHFGLSDPQEVFDIRLFREDPAIFYSVARHLLPQQGLHSGTPTHKFIKLLSERGQLLRNYTQNIDNIERFVGIPEERVVQCHGSIGSFHCITCGFAIADGASLFPQIEAGEIPLCPKCHAKKPEDAKPASASASKRMRLENDDEGQSDDNASHGVLKPDITFFGESLPDRFDHMLFEAGDAENCDLVVCIGTSLRVSPVNQVVKVVKHSTPQIYISKTPAPGTFEVSFLGSCDDVVELLCQKMKWRLEHPMEKRPKDMPPKEYPGGSIDVQDGIFRFVDTKNEETNPSEAAVEAREAAVDAIDTIVKDEEEGTEAQKKAETSP